MYSPCPYLCNSYTCGVCFCDTQSVIYLSLWLIYALLLIVAQIIWNGIGWIFSGNFFGNDTVLKLSAIHSKNMNSSASRVHSMLNCRRSTCSVKDGDLFLLLQKKSSVFLLQPARARCEDRSEPFLLQRWNCSNENFIAYHGVLFLSTLEIWEYLYQAQLQDTRVCEEMDMIYE